MPRPRSPDPAAYEHWPASVVQIVFPDAGLVVAEKPAGLPSTGRTVDDPDCLQALLRARLRRPRVWAVHQLDTNTSGLNLFVLRKEAVAEWAARLRWPTRKTYLAIARGRWDGPSRIEEPIGTVAFTAADGTRRGRPGVASDGQPAATRVRLLQATADASLLELTLETGRTHQVRVHLAHHGHPLVGEALHVEAPCHRAPRHLLHAWRVTFPAWRGRPWSRLEAALPQDFLDAARDLGLTPPV